MKFSKNKINEYIELYLNDLEDFDDTDYTLVESTLNLLKPTILESKKDILETLKTVYNTLPSEKQGVLKDFILYIKEI
jgi:hypothetical protein